MATHAENIGRWHDDYISTAGAAAPGLHEDHSIQWGVTDAGGDSLTVRLDYTTHHSGEEHLEQQPLIDALEALEKGYDFRLANTQRFGPLYTFGGSTRITHGREYQVPVTDFPGELVAVRTELLGRARQIHELVIALKGLKSDVSALYIYSPDFATMDISGPLGDRLLEMQRQAIEACPARYQDDLKLYQDRILDCLGMPSGAPSLATNEEKSKVTVERNWARFSTEEAEKA